MRTFFPFPESPRKILFPLLRPLLALISKAALRRAFGAHTAAARFRSAEILVHQPNRKLRAVIALIALCSLPTCAGRQPQSGTNVNIRLRLRPAFSPSATARQSPAFRFPVRCSPQASSLLLRTRLARDKKYFLAITRKIDSAASKYSLSPPQQGQQPFSAAGVLPDMSYLGCNSAALNPILRFCESRDTPCSVR